MEKGASSHSADEDQSVFKVLSSTSLLPSFVSATELLSRKATRDVIVGLLITAD